MNRLTGAIQRRSGVIQVVFVHAYDGEIQSLRIAHDESHLQSDKKENKVAYVAA